jgi:hypothetical protein
MGSYYENKFDITINICHVSTSAGVKLKHYHCYFPFVSVQLFVSAVQQTLILVVSPIILIEAFHLDIFNMVLKHGLYK